MTNIHLWRKKASLSYWKKEHLVSCYRYPLLVIKSITNQRPHMGQSNCNMLVAPECYRRNIITHSLSRSPIWCKPSGKNGYKRATRQRGSKRRKMQTDGFGWIRWVVAAAGIKTLWETSALIWNWSLTQVCFFSCETTEKPQLNLDNICQYSLWINVFHHSDSRRVEYLFWLWTLYEPIGNISEK